MPQPEQPPSPPCPFCDPDPIANTILHQGTDFYVMADFAPQTTGHALIIPRQHYPHLAAMPPELDEEFVDLKKSFGAFFLQHYGELTFWEHGVFGQTVPHAHQQVLSTRIDPALFRQRGIEFRTPKELRAAWGRYREPYFSVESEGFSRFLPPEVELSRKLVNYARETQGGNWLLPPDVRRANGAPLIEALAQAWRGFQSA